MVWKNRENVLGYLSIHSYHYESKLHRRMVVGSTFIKLLVDKGRDGGKGAGTCLRLPEHVLQRRQLCDAGQMSHGVLHDMSWQVMTEHDRSFMRNDAYIFSVQRRQIKQGFWGIWSKRRLKEEMRISKHIDTLICNNIVQARHADVCSATTPSTNGKWRKQHLQRRKRKDNGFFDLLTSFLMNKSTTCSTITVQQPEIEVVQHSFHQPLKWML